MNKGVFRVTSSVGALRKLRFSVFGSTDAVQGLLGDSCKGLMTLLNVGLKTQSVHGQQASLHFKRLDG